MWRAFDGDGDGERRRAHKKSICLLAPVYRRIYIELSVWVVEPFATEKVAQFVLYRKKTRFERLRLSSAFLWRFELATSSSLVSSARHR